MDRHTCKLCFRRFANGRALGGHMRSHVAAGAMPPARPIHQEPSPSPSFSSSASHEEQEAEAADAAAADAEAAGIEAKQLAYYGLRENPRKSYRLVDPEFSSTFVAGDHGTAVTGAAAGAGSSVVLQDWESETETSKPPPAPLRRRSSHRRRPAPQFLPPAKPEPIFDAEPVSSISDTTPEEDVARCLMMLSRDVWTSVTASKRRKAYVGDMAGDEEDEGEEEQKFGNGLGENRAAAVRSRKGCRRRYQCGTCGKVFRSYQALGGHRASHKNGKPCSGSFSHAANRMALDSEDGEEYEHEHGHIGTGIPDADSEVYACSGERRVHKCPVCFRVFSSGQALGGHKRSHLVAYTSGCNNRTLLPPPDGAAADASKVASASPSWRGGIGGAAVVPGFAQKFGGESLIDLNLPAPIDDEVEMSAVFDEEQ